MFPPRRVANTRVRQLLLFFASRISRILTLLRAYRLSFFFFLLLFARITAVVLSLINPAESRCIFSGGVGRNYTHIAMPLNRIKLAVTRKYREVRNISREPESGRYARARAGNG